MIIETQASSLLEAIQWSSRVSRTNENNKSILLDTTELIKLYASGSSVYSEALVNGRFDANEKHLLPLTIMPHLQGFKERVITLDIDYDRILIQSGRDSIRLNQIAGKVSDISTRPYQPEWLGLDLLRLGDLRYASSNELGFDVFWMYNKSVVASDRVKIAVYRPEVGGVDFELTIPNFITSYLPKEEIDLSIIKYKYIWFGNNQASISTTAISRPIPEPLKQLTNIFEFTDFVTVSKDELQNKTRMAARFLDNNNISFRLIFTPESLAIQSTSSNGAAENLELLSVHSDLKDKKEILVNGRFLSQAVTNCNSPQVKIGITDIGLPLVYIVDFDLIHFLVPLRN